MGISFAWCSKKRVQVIQYVKGTLNFGTSNTAAQVRDTVRTHRTQRVVTNMRSGPQLYNVSVRSTPAKQASTNNNRERLVRHKFLRSGAIIVAITIRRLRIFPISTFTCKVMITRVGEHVTRYPSFANVIHVRISERMRVHICPRRVIFGKDDKDSRTHRIGVNVVNKARRNITIYLHLVVCARPVIIHRNVRRPCHGVTQGANFSVNVRGARRGLIFAQLLYFPRRHIGAIVAAIRDVEGEIGLWIVVFFSCARDTIRCTSNCKTCDDSCVVILTLPTNLFRHVRTCSSVFGLAVAVEDRSKWSSNPMIHSTRLRATTVTRCVGTNVLSISCKPRVVEVRSHRINLVFRAFWASKCSLRGEYSTKASSSVYKGHPLKIEGQLSLVSSFAIRASPAER